MTQRARAVQVFAAPYSARLLRENYHSPLFLLLTPVYTASQKKSQLISKIL